MTRTWTSGSVPETLAIGAELARELEPDGALLLVGELGCGKSVLARGVAQGLGFREQDIQSPTYTLVHEYESGDRRLVHADLYRLEPAQLDSTGVEETLAGPGVKVVEWADRLPFAVAGAVLLRISVDACGRRRIEQADESVELGSGSKNIRGGNE